MKNIGLDTQEAIQELLEKSGAVNALHGGVGSLKNPEQALTTALADRDCAVRVEGILRSKLAELKAYCAHVECPEDTEVCTVFEEIDGGDENNICVICTSPPLPSSSQLSRHYHHRTFARWSRLCLTEGSLDTIAWLRVAR